MMRFFGGGALRGISGLHVCKPYRSVFILLFFTVFGFFDSVGAKSSRLSKLSDCVCVHFLSRGTCFKMFFLLVQLCGQCGWAFFVLFSLLVQVFLGDVAIRKDMYENIVLCAGLIVLTVVTNAATYNYSNVHVFSSVATTSSNVGSYLSADSTSHPGGTA